MGGLVYLGSANIQTQHLGSDLQRLCMEDLSYHPETCLEKKRKQTKKKNTHKQGLQMTKYYRKSLSSRDKG